MYSAANVGNDPDIRITITPITHENRQSCTRASPLVLDTSEPNSRCMVRVTPCKHCEISQCACREHVWSVPQTLIISTHDNHNLVAKTRNGHVAVRAFWMGERQYAINTWPCYILNGRGYEQLRLYLGIEPTCWSNLEY